MYARARFHRRQRGGLSRGAIRARARREGPNYLSLAIEDFDGKIRRSLGKAVIDRRPLQRPNDVSRLEQIRAPTGNLLRKLS